MDTELDFTVVDVFTAKRYGGNPAAVLFGADGVVDDRLQAIAAEFHHSATTVVLPSDRPDAAIRFRWFTPAMEARMCGHAALAGVHALLERGRFASVLAQPGTTLAIQTAAGVLQVQVEPAPGRHDGLLIWLDLPRPQLTSRSVDTGKLADLLGIDLGAIDRGLPIMETQDDDLIVFVETFGAMADARPHFAELSAWCARHRLRGICVATLNTLTPSTHVQSRFFAPAGGVDEDPVTGSVHGPLAAYLVAHDLVPHAQGTAAVTCVQGEAGGRAGLVRVLVTRRPGEGYAVRIAGECRTTMRGKLLV